LVGGRLVISGGSWFMVGLEYKKSKPRARAKNILTHFLERRT
jgi:hypothetical protein